MTNSNFYGKEKIIEKLNDDITRIGDCKRYDLNTRQYECEKDNEGSSAQVRVINGFRSIIDHCLDFGKNNEIPVEEIGKLNNIIDKSLVNAVFYCGMRAYEEESVENKLIFLDYMFGLREVHNLAIGLYAKDGNNPVLTSPVISGLLKKFSSDSYVFIGGGNQQNIPQKYTPLKILENDIRELKDLWGIS
ncbi:MAG: hypothetical protein KAS32_29580 [Candidatus Peribacteraceae bacterium]|nr:hypothetical protein [Candidatus Peribacteraceae bacterium]